MYGTLKSHRYALVAFFIVFIIFDIFFFHEINLDPKFNTLLIAVTLTYSLFIGLILFLIENRYIKVRESLSLLNSKLQAIFNLSNDFGDKKFADSIRKTIDRYLVCEIEANIDDYNKTQPISYEFYKCLENIKIKDNYKSRIFSNIVTSIVDLSDHREIIELYSKKVLTVPINMLYNFITFITIIIFMISILTLKTYISFIFILYLFFFIYFTYLIKDIDDLNIDKLSLKHSNRKQLFDLIGTLPFCGNEKFIRFNVYGLKRGDKYRMHDSNGKIIVRTF
ncbi:MAG: hypothetical protein AABY07_10035 [Nanoarchaeota archaeon]